jgi:hypothetical protein
MVSPQDFRDFPKGSIAAATKFGPAPKFGFKNPLPFFNLPPTRSVLPTTNSDIVSVDHYPPSPTKPQLKSTRSTQTTNPNTLHRITRVDFARSVGYIWSFYPGGTSQFTTSAVMISAHEIRQDSIKAPTSDSQSRPLPPSLYACLRQGHCAFQCKSQ